MPAGPTEVVEGNSGGRWAGEPAGTAVPLFRRPLTGKPQTPPVLKLLSAISPPTSQRPCLGRKLRLHLRRLRLHLVWRLRLGGGNTGLRSGLCGP